MEWEDAKPATATLRSLAGRELNLRLAERLITFPAQAKATYRFGPGSPLENKHS